MKNLKIFSKINEKASFKLAPALCAIALSASITPAYAESFLTIDYTYSGDLVSLINPLYWDYDYNTVEINSEHTHMRMGKDEFNKLIDTNEDIITINDGNTVITYDVNELKEASLEAEKIYSPNTELIKKIALNGGITIAVLGFTVLAISEESKQKKLK